MYAREIGALAYLFAYTEAVPLILPNISDARYRESQLHIL